MTIVRVTIYEYLKQMTSTLNKHKRESQNYCHWFILKTLVFLSCHFSDVSLAFSSSSSSACSPMMFHLRSFFIVSRDFLFSFRLRRIFHSTNTHTHPQEINTKSKTSFQTVDLLSKIRIYIWIFYRIVSIDWLIRLRETLWLMVVVQIIRVVNEKHNYV